jgi:hypothetical protein
MAGNQIQHTMTIQGIVTPAIIHNSNYFFINLPVHANGLIDAWDMLDLPLFLEKLQRGWVVTQIPNGEHISIHGLGDWEVQDGQWEYTADSFYKHVLSLIRELNPALQNLYNCHGTTTKKVGNSNVSVLGSSKETPVRAEDPSAFFPKMLKGESLSIFYQEGEVIYLADLRVFSDGKVEIGRIPAPKLWTLDELAQAIKEGQILTTPPLGSRIQIYQFGSFTRGEKGWSKELSDLLSEVRDVIETCNGRPDSVSVCSRLFDEYVKAPSEALRDKLRVAYEAIPTHNRMFVGDMDTKDIPVRMIISGDQEIEHWTHRAVAKKLGHEPLPTIRVPKPKK